MSPAQYIMLVPLLFFAFIPVWAGGQAMRCYNEGYIWRSVACVWVAVTMNVGIFLLGCAFIRYNLNLVTIWGVLKL
jgi:hypothetical protein